MSPRQRAFTGIRPLAYQARPPVVLHLYLHLQEPTLISEAYARRGVRSGRWPQYAASPATTGTAVHTWPLVVC